MANFEPVFTSYAAGMKRDFPREMMPEGAVWNMAELLPVVANTRLRKRGGWTHASQDITAVQATADHLRAGIWAPYSAGTSILVWDEDGRVYEVESTTATENIGASVLPSMPVFYDNKVIVPNLGGVPDKITRSGGVHTVADLGGTPPSAAFALVHKDVVWLLRSNANPDRIWFSAAGNAESWDTTNKWLDVSFEIQGGVALSNAVLVFMKERTARIRGSIPPPDSDFIVDDPIFDIGCTDERSIAKYRDKAVWANGQGLYITDGTAVEDLTRLCGMKSWWRDVMAGRQGFASGAAYDASTWRISGGVYGDYYFYSVMNGVPVIIDGGFIDLNTYTWHRMDNMDSRFFFPRPFPEELFFCRWQDARLGQLSPIFDPTATNKADGDGVPVLPFVEYPFWEGSPGLKTLRGLALTYDIRDAASDNPSLALSYVDSPESTSYVDLAVFNETTRYTRKRVPLNFSAYGVGFSLTQLNASSDTRIYGVELDAFARDTAHDDF